MAVNTSIFILEDDAFYAALLKQKIEDRQLGTVRVFHTVKAFWAHLHEKPQIIILDYFLKRSNGLEVLKKIRINHPKCKCILLSGQESMKVAVKTLKHGAYGYVEKNSVAIDRVVHLIRKIKFERNARRVQLGQQLIFGVLIFLLIMGLVYCLWL